MSNPEFRLLPWEHRGIEPAPAHQLDARIEGVARRFDVRRREGRVYFRFAGGDDGRVWMLQNECPSPDSNFELIWRAEVEANRVARFFVVERGFSTQSVDVRFGRELEANFHPSNLNLFGPTTFAVAASDDGLGWAQEWCGGRWVAFPLPVRAPRSGARCPSIWHRGWNAAGLRRAIAPLAGEFAFRPFGREQGRDEPLRWARGSQSELERLCRAACGALVQKPHQSVARASWNRSSESQNVRASFSVDAETAQAGVRFSHYFRFSYYSALVPDPLMGLFIEHNLPVGGSWQEVSHAPFELDENEEIVEPATPTPFPLRVHREFAPHTLQFEVAVDAQPSAHERLEAVLTLREWLEGKWPRERIEELLSP